MHKIDPDLRGRPNVRRNDDVTFLEGLRDPHWLHFGQIGRVEVVEKHEATAGDALGCARHDASRGASSIESEDAGRTTASRPFM